MLKNFEKNWSSIAYIFCLLIVVCLIIVVWQGFRPQSIVIISNKGIDKVRIDSAQAVIKKKIYEKSYSAYSDSALNLQIRSITDELENIYWNVGINDSLSWKTFLSKNDITTDKDSQLSLWAAALAVIFVLFSVYGLVKIDTTLDKLKETESKMDEKLKKIDTEKKVLKMYKKILPYFATYDINCRKKLLYEVNNFKNIKDIANYIIEPLYCLKALNEHIYPAHVIEKEEEDRYKLVMKLSKIIIDNEENKNSIIDLNRTKMIYALSNYHLYKMGCSHVLPNDIKTLFDNVEDDLRDMEFILCYNSLKSDIAEDDKTLKEIIEKLKIKSL